RSRARFRQIRYASYWLPLIAVPLWDVVITRSCFCSHGWVCVRAKWHFSNSMTLTGRRDASASAVKVVGGPIYHYPTMSVKRLLSICSVDGHEAPAAVCSYEVEPPSAVFWDRVPSDRSFAIHSSEPVLMRPRWAHTSSDMRWQPRCCARGLRSPRS